MNGFRLQALEDKLVEKDKLLLQNAEKFHKLKEDFKFNLMLLEERDQELERYDIATTGMVAYRSYSFFFLYHLIFEASNLLFYMHFKIFFAAVNLKTKYLKLQLLVH